MTSYEKCCATFHDLSKFMVLSFNVLKETQHQRMEGRFTVNEN